MFKMRWVMAGGTPVELELPASWMVLDGLDATDDLTEE